MQVFVREPFTMIAAPVQRDVDGVPKGSHFARVPPRSSSSGLAGSPSGGAFLPAGRPAGLGAGPALPPSLWRSSPAAPPQPLSTGTAVAGDASALGCPLAAGRGVAGV